MPQCTRADIAIDRRYDEAAQEFAKALELDPNDADCWGFKSDLSTLNGNPELGLAEIEKAFRLNPVPLDWYYLLKGQAQYALGQYEAAAQTLRHEATYRTHSRRFLAASLAQLGCIEEARREAKMFMVTNPAFWIGHWAATQPFQDKALLERFVEGCRRAGLPE
jgi:tetratricopeptide (TPR) repeat protein